MKLTNKQRKTEIIAALLFILATLSYGFGSGGLAALIVKDSSFSSMLPYALLEVINNASVVGIGVCFYILFKDQHQKASNLYLVSRVGEGILLTIGTVLAVINAGSDKAIVYHDTFFALAMISLGVISVWYFIYHIKNEIGPKWLNVIGVVGYVLLTLYSVMYLIPGVTASMLLFGPGAIFEIALPLYLLFRGYKLSIK